MSDTPFNPIPRWRKPEEAMDLLDPAQHFQGDAPSPKEREEVVRKAEADERAKIEAEKLAKEKKKLEAQRKERKTRAGRKGRRASIVTGPLGVQEQETVRRASLGAA